MSQDIRKFIGSPSQLLNVSTYRLEGGRSHGVLCTEVDDGKGLNVLFAADRCMDIQRVRYKGVNFSYITDNSIPSPAYYNDRGIEYLRTFVPGFIMTCGLTNIGSPCVDEGEELGLHGRIHHTPADEYSVSVLPKDVSDVAKDGYSVKLSGKMIQSRVFGEHLVLDREYEMKYGSGKMTLTDTVQNAGFRAAPYMQLYHINFGYPFLSPDLEISIPTLDVTPRTELAKERLASWNKVSLPKDGDDETCYYHKMGKNSDGISSVILYNRSLDIGICYEYDARILDHFVEWQLFGSGEYILGMEPCNGPIEGRDAARKRGELKFLQPGEKVVNRIKFSFFEGKEAFDSFRGKQKEMVK